MTVLPRALNPVAWWLWAIGLAVAASRTSNPLLLLLIFAVLGLVVALRRPQAPWARGYRFYLLMAGRGHRDRVVFSVVFAAGPSAGDHILFRLPAVPVPSWYAGVRIGGPVSAEAVLTAAVDGVRLACLLCCIGAANTLANPKRALRVLPGALYELGAAVTVALSLAPQLVESVARVRAARRLRGATGQAALAAGGPVRAVRAVRAGLVVGASGRCAASRSRCCTTRWTDRCGWPPRWTPAATAGPVRASPAARRLTAGLMLTGLAGLCLGGYELLDPTVPHPVGLGGFAVGSVLCVAGLALGGRRVSRSRYRPDPWRWPEWLVVASGITSAVVLSLNVGYDPAALNPGFHPLHGRRCRCCPRPRSSWPPSPPWRLRHRRLPGPVELAVARARARRPADRGEPMIEFDRVGVRYDGAAAPALTNITLRIDEGELCLVIGSTGSGKSTLLGAINGLVPHFTGGTLAGRVLVDGRDTARFPPRELADVVGLVGQDPLAGFVTDTVEEELAYTMEQLAIDPAAMRARCEETLDLLGIADLRRRALRTCPAASSSGSRSAPR